MKLDAEEYVHAIKNGVRDCHVDRCYDDWDEIGMECTKLEELITDTTAPLHATTRELLSTEIKQRLLNVLASIYKVTRNQN